MYVPVKYSTDFLNSKKCFLFLPRNVYTKTQIALLVIIKLMNR